ncbi:MAG TPA: SET domain-containing protein [Chitinophagaceae bacterium]|nr:SET domain-containing protein [Chitinophagaceae bacterium]
MPYLAVTASPKGGRGVFTTENIPANTVIEISPVIVLSKKERKAVEETIIYHYLFEWGKTRTMGCLGLGYLSLYNHDYNSNCDYEMDFEHRIMTIKTVRAIKKGEELSVNYNAHPTDTTPVWFNAK